jgi:hypothetical protein
MCVEIYNTDTRQTIESPKELAEIFSVKVEDLPLAEGYSDVSPNACLCQVDIEQACKHAGYDCKTDDFFDVYIRKKNEKE